MLKVVTNLVLNATEAVSENGQVRIETGQSNGWACSPWPTTAAA